MATTNEVKNAIATVDPANSLQSLIEKSANELSKALPEHMRPERMVRIALTCIRLNPELGKCTPASFLGALFTAAQLGLDPIAGRAYLIPFNNKRKIAGEWKTFKEVQFVMGYKGVVELFYRHEKAVQISWGVVRQGDDFAYEYGTNAFLRHREAKTNRGEVEGFWAMATLQGGGKPFLYWSYEDCIEHGKKHSKTYDSKSGKFYDSSPWETETELMCLKSVLIQLAKLLPLSSEFQKALGADETSRDYRKEIDDALDLPVTTDWSEVPLENGKTEEKAKTEPKESFLESVKVAKEQVDATEYDQLLLRYKVSDPYELTHPEQQRQFLIDAGKLTKKTMVKA
mgnify:CR=1 FL=1